MTFHAWQVAVIACGVLLTLPLIERTHLGTEFASDTQITSAAHSFVIHGTMLAAIALFGTAGGVLPAGLRAASSRARRRRRRRLFSNIEDLPLHALRVLIFVLATHCIVGVARGMCAIDPWRAKPGPSLVFALMRSGRRRSGPPISLIRANREPG